MKKRSIKNHILLLSIAPGIIISLLISTYLIHAYSSSLQKSLIERGLSKTNAFFRSTEHRIKEHQDKEKLQEIAHNALGEYGLRAARIYDKHLNPMAQAGISIKFRGDIIKEFSQPGNINISETTNTFIFSKPIYSKGTEVEALIELEFSKDPLITLQRQTKWISLIIIGIGLIICWVYSTYTTNNFLHPINHIINSIKESDKGKFEAIPEKIQFTEFQDLEKSVESLAATSHKSQEEMKRGIMHATQELRGSLETVEIQKIELDIARKEALTASQIKSEFLANTSHEIRTPLNSIMGFTKLLLNTQIDRVQRDYLNSISKSSDGLLTIINDILDFSKMEAGKLILDHVPMNLKEVVEDVLTLLAPAAHAKFIPLASLFYSDVPTKLIADPLRIKQILTNLISNAIKFTEQGEVIVRVILEDSRDEQAAVLKVTISDTGIGLSTQHQKDIFHPFSQADASTSRRFGGTGLGLIIAKRLVEQMGGDIGVESHLGKGSTFWFTILVDVDKDEEYEDLLDLQDKRIVLYENHEITRLSITHHLTEWGINFDIVHTLHEAQTLIEKNLIEQTPYDAAIIGIDLLKDINAEFPSKVAFIQNNLACPVLALSNTSEITDLHIQIEENVSSCEMKPIHHHKLYHSLYQVINKLPDSISSDDNNQYKPKSLSNSPHILAVDDHPTNLKLISVLLGEMGAKISLAENGLEAVEMADKEPFDLILMDIQMPEMDGYDATRNIRNKPNPNQHTPIIALTAHTLANEQQKLITAGMNDYTLKPIDEKKLYELIHEWTNFKEMAPQEPAPLTTTASPQATTKPPQNQQETNLQKNMEIQKEDEGIIDIPLSLQRAGNKPALAKDMLQMLCGTLLEDKKGINEAYSEQRLDDMQDNVHRLHGATKYCGIPSLTEHLRSLETQLKQNETQQLDITLDRVNERIDTLLKWAKEHEEELENGSLFLLDEPAATPPSYHAKIP